MISRTITLSKRLTQKVMEVFDNPQRVFQRLIRYVKVCVFRMRTTCRPSSSFVSYLPKYGIRMRMRFEDSIALPVFLCEFERDVCDFINKFLKPGMVFFDVGAYLGLYSLMASRLVGSLGQVHAFEPSPHEFHDLIKNIRLNCFQNISANKIAVSNHCSNSIPYYLCPDGMGAFNSLLRPSHPFIQDLNLDVITVESITLDEYIMRYQIRRVDLIKLDIEGAELLALQGAKSLLSHDEAPVIICELSDLTTSVYGTSAIEVLLWLKEQGFSVYEFNLKTKSLVPAQERTHYVYNNIIAVKYKDLANLRQFNIG